MESSKRIFVVLSTILFLEASAFNYYSNYPSSIPTNYPNNQARSPEAPFLNNGPAPSPGTLGQISNQQTNYNNNDNKFASNSYQSGNVPPLNRNFNSGLGSTYIGNSNSGQDLTLNGRPKNVYGPNLGGFNGAHQSNSNEGTSVSPTYPLPLSTTSLTQPLLTQNTQLGYSYNGVSNNPAATGIYSSQNPHGSLLNTGEDNVNIVDVPIDLGFGLTQSIKLPIAGNAKYKVMHVTPPESIPANVLPTVNPKLNLNVPNNVLNTVEQVESKLDGELGEGDNQKSASSSVSGAQYGNLFNNGYNYPATNIFFKYIPPYGISNNPAQASATSNTVRQDEYMIPNNVIKTITQADLELKRVLSENEKVKDNQQDLPQNMYPTSTSTTTATGSQYGSLYNNGLRYPGTTTLYSYNQPYGNNQVAPLSYSNAQAFATSDAIKHDGQNGNVLNFSTNKELSALPNNVLNNNAQAGSKLNGAQGEGDNQKSATSPVAGVQHGNLFNNGYNYPATNNLNNYYQPYVSSNSQAQASGTSNNLIKTQTDLEKVQDNQRDLPQKISATSTSATSSTETGSQNGNFYNNGVHYPASNTMYNYNQLYGNSYVTPLSYNNAQASATAGAIKQDGYNEYDLKYNTNILLNKEFSAPMPTNLKSSEVLDSTKRENMKDNQPKYPLGYGNHGPLTSSDNAQGAASTSSASSSTQNEYGNYYYPTPKPADVTGINQPQPINAPNHKTINDVHNRYNNNNNYNPQLGNYLNYNPSPNWQNYQNQPASISPQSTNSYVAPNNPTTLGNVQDSGDSYTKTNDGSNYPIYNAPSPNQPIGEQSSINMDESNYDQGYNGDDLSNGSTDTTQSTATASSNIESFSPALSTFNFPSYNNYNTYPQQNLNERIHHKYSPNYELNYGPTTIQPPTTDSPINENRVPTDNPTILKNEQASTLLFGQNDSSKAENTASEEATADSSQTLTTSYQQKANSQGHYPLYGQEYQSHLIPSSYAPEDTVTNNPIGTGNEQGSGIPYGQTSNESNNPTNNIPLYNNDDDTQTYSDNTNEKILYGGIYHKYSPIYKPYYGNQHQNIQPQTTDSPVDEDTIQDNPTRLWNYGFNSPTNDSPGSLVDDSMQTDTIINDKNYKTQNFVDSVNEEEAIPNVDKNDVVKTKIGDSSAAIADSEPGNTNYNNQPSVLNHRRYLNRGNHPRYPHRRWHRYGRPHHFKHPKFSKYPDNQYPIPHHLTSLGNEQESSVSYSVTNNESINNVPLSNNNDVSQTSSTDSTNDLAYGNERNDDSSNSNVAQSTAVASSQSESNVELSNTDYYTAPNDYPFNNQPLSNSHNNDGDYSLNKQNTLYNYPYYYNLPNDGDNNQQDTNSPNNADNSFNNQVINNNDEYTTQNPPIVTTTDANYVDYDYNGSFTKYSEQLVETDKTEQTEMVNNKDKVTKEDSSSSNTVFQMQDTVIKNQGQSSTNYDNKSSGFSNIGITLNTKPDGTPYSRAFEALLNILDSIEKLFGSSTPKIPNTK